MNKVILSAAFALTFAACGGVTENPTTDSFATHEAGERWSSQDNPALFGEQLQFNLDALPMSGEAAVIPWAGSYWPTYEDSINFKWQGPESDSPAMKYQKAFGGTNVEDMVSRYHGIDSTSGATCTDASTCNSSLGETCAIRDGATSGRCVPTWWGICHAWAPASIQLPEPKHPVTVNGVEFRVQDIKALATLVYNKTSTRFVSLRCNANDDAGQINYDEYGRPVAANRACRDTNPGTYHVLLTNYLGLKSQSFVEDRTFDYQVWNQPLRSFEITEKRPVTAQEANQLIGATQVGGEVTDLTGTVQAEELVQFGAFAVTAGQSIRVATTGNNDADLYVRFGTAPATDTYDCASTSPSSTEACELTVPEGATEVFVGVYGYTGPVDFTLKLTVGGSIPENYLFNTDAVSFVYVQSRVRYISEASSFTDGNLSSTIDRYTRTDAYEYILEVDANGNIIGGEWVGSSKRNHPDFVWLPIGPSTQTVAGGTIALQTVRSLVEQSVAE